MLMRCVALLTGTFALIGCASREKWSLDRTYQVAIVLNWNAKPAMVHWMSFEADARAVVKAPVPTELEILYFEVFADWRDFPVRAFALDRMNNEVFFEAPFSAAVRVGLLASRV